uniref:ATP synthase F0 subunit 8 n=1 Tax=Criorhina nigriventris TaxID=1822510 RepID=UPI0026E114E8|nr:ATP synthase F0 subunit 8 [Criorhina nigriventris]WJW73583.1 ATP synthase F0 subunit 8 [Criorhina nigriventris]
MPQMAPISWLSLFLLFTLIFFLFNMMNYFTYLSPTPKSTSSDQIDTKSMTWKW